MRIDGDLDLDLAQFPFPLDVRMCVFRGDILLRTARLRGLYLRRTHIQGLAVEGTKIEGSVFLCKVKAEGQVGFSGATIGGSLECDGTQLTNRDPKALTGDGAKIEGSVILSNGFKAEGEVRFRLATIGGDLVCDGAQLTNSDQSALIADGAKFAGYVVLKDFKAKGEVGFRFASIGGSLECDGIQLTNPGGKALIADGATISGSAFLHHGFKAEGEVSFAGATIAGNLVCDGAQLINSDQSALMADGAKIAGSVLHNRLKAEGQVGFRGAMIGGNLECNRAQLTNPQGCALLAEAATTGDSVLLRDGFCAHGIVNFRASDISKALEWRGTASPEKQTVDLRYANVGTLWDDVASWPAPGNLFLDGFTYNRLDNRAPLKAKDRIVWLQQHRVFLPQPYEQLASVLRVMGHEEEARGVLIQKSREYARFTRPFSQEWFWYKWVGRHLIGYGYEPWRALVISLNLTSAATSPISLGIVLGLVVGKPIGISCASWLAVRLRLASLPAHVIWRQILGAGALGGIGFTMSIFIAGLAFTEQSLLEIAKLGIFVGSLLAGGTGFLLLFKSGRA